MKQIKRRNFGRVTGRESSSSSSSSAAAAAEVVEIPEKAQGD